MARFLDSSPEELEDGEEYSPVEEEQMPEEAQPAEPEEIQEAQEEDDIPEKYQGKDIKDIVRMHQEAEKLLGKQSSEVGELRKIVDDFVKTQLEAKNSPQEIVEDIDIFDDPDKYIEQKFKDHPKLKEVEELTRSMKQQEIINKLQSSHPDFQDIIQSDKFGEWVAKSKVRTELYQRADQKFDFDAADELLTLWKERQSIVKETAEMQETDRKRQLKSASTGNAKGSGESPSRKIYRRADIIELMKTNPKRYQALHDEIMLAYAEKRVK
jgi:hypothetical protein